MCVSAERSFVTPRVPSLSGRASSDADEVVQVLEDVTGKSFFNALDVEPEELLVADSWALELVLEALWVELDSWVEDAWEEDSAAFVLLEWAAEVVATAVLVASTEEEAETDATVLVAMSEMAEAEERGLHVLLW